MTLITAQDLSVGYEGKPVAEHISFTVNEGDYLCIVGENGSGKTTLMKTLLRLQAPLSGTIHREGDLNGGAIGYLPQQSEAQKDFPASVKEIVQSGALKSCGFRPFYNKKEKALALQNMQRLGIADLANQCYRELSGGQQQRVLLARALCAAGKILLLDEPVAGLDPLVTAELYELIAQLNREGLTILMISHDIASTLQYASHILHIGEHIFFGTKEEYLQSEAGRRFLTIEAAVTEGGLS